MSAISVIWLSVIASLVVASVSSVFVAYFVVLPTVISKFFANRSRITKLMTRILILAGVAAGFGALAFWGIARA